MHLGEIWRRAWWTSLRPCPDTVVITFGRTFEHRPLDALVSPTCPSRQKRADASPARGEIRFAKAHSSYGLHRGPHHCPQTCDGSLSAKVSMTASAQASRSKHDRSAEILYKREVFARAAGLCCRLLPLCPLQIPRRASSFHQSGLPQSSASGQSTKARVFW